MPGGAASRVVLIGKAESMALELAKAGETHSCTSAGRAAAPAGPHPPAPSAGRLPSCLLTPAAAADRLSRPGGGQSARARANLAPAARCLPPWALLPPAGRRGRGLVPAAGSQQASDSSTLGCRSLARALSVLVCELASASVMAGAHKQRAKGTKHVVEAFPCKWPIQGQLWLTCPPAAPCCVAQPASSLIWKHTGSLAAAAAPALPYLAQQYPGRLARARCRSVKVPQAINRARPPSCSPPSRQRRRSRHAAATAVGRAAGPPPAVSSRARRPQLQVAAEGEL